MNKNLHTQEAKNFVNFFNIIQDNMPRWQNEYCPRSKTIYVGGLPANATSDEVFWTVRKCIKIHFSLKLHLHLSVVEKFAKFGSPSGVRRALLSLNLKNFMMLKVFFCLALIGSLYSSQSHMWFAKKWQIFAYFIHKL